MTKNADNGGAAYLPAQGGFGYLAARIDAYGGKEPLSTAIYDSPEEAEAGALRMIKKEQDRLRRAEAIDRRDNALVEIFAPASGAIFFGCVAWMSFNFSGGFNTPIYFGYCVLLVAAIFGAVSINALANKDVRRAAFGKGLADD